VIPNRIIIAGGGAAGFFAAISAAESNSKAEVILLEKTPISWQKFVSQEEVAAMSLTPVSTPANSPPATPEAVAP